MIALARHRALRHRLVPHVGPLVGHPEPSVASTACATLGQLGSQEAVPWLVVALERESDGVAEDANEALKRLTGLQLPSDEGQWTAALGL